MVDSVSVRFKSARVEKSKNAFRHNYRIQWNVGTACVSDCVLKTLASRGVRVGPSKVQQTYPPAQNQYMQEEILGEFIFARMHARPVFALARIQENMFLKDHFPQNSSILKGIQVGANTCRACIRTRANTGKYSWRISEELKKAVAVSEEKIQQRSRRRGRFSSSCFPCRKVPNLGRDSISCCRKIGEEFSSSVEICPKTFPARNLGQPQPSRVF